MFRIYCSFTRFTAVILYVLSQVHFITPQSKSSGNRGREGHSILLNRTGVQREIIPFPYIFLVQEIFLLLWYWSKFLNLLIYFYKKPTAVYLRGSFLF